MYHRSHTLQFHKQIFNCGKCSRFRRLGGQIKVSGQAMRWNDYWKWIFIYLIGKLELEQPLWRLVSKWLKKWTFFFFFACFENSFFFLIYFSNRRMKTSIFYFWFVFYVTLTCQLQIFAMSVNLFDLIVM